MTTSRLTTLTALLVGSACSGRAAAPAGPVASPRVPDRVVEVDAAPRGEDAADGAARPDAGPAQANSPRTLGCSAGGCEVANLGLTAAGIEVVAADAQAVAGQAWSTTMSLRNASARPRTVRFAVDGAPWVEPADGTDLPGRAGCGIARGHGYGLDPELTVPARGVLEVSARGVAGYQDCAGAEHVLPIGRYRVVWSTTLGTLQSRLDVLGW